MIHLLEKLKGTREYDIIAGLENIYADINDREQSWKETSGVSCTDGCGSCCVAFEPDVLESEALYLALWLIENEPAAARSIREETFPLMRRDNEAGCFLFDPDNPYHCTVYGGRCLICRLFGYTGDRGKKNEIRWKPCRFLPDAVLARHNPPILHRQYSEDDIQETFGGLPPVMSDIMSQAISLSPDSSGDTKPLREALPDALRRLQFILAYRAASADSPDSAPESA